MTCEYICIYILLLNDKKTIKVQDTKCRLWMFCVSTGEMSFCSKSYNKVCGFIAFYMCRWKVKCTILFAENWSCLQLKEMKFSKQKVACIHQIRVSDCYFFVL